MKGEEQEEKVSLRKGRREEGSSSPSPSPSSSRPELQGVPQILEVSAARKASRRRFEIGIKVKSQISGDGGGREEEW